MLFRYLPSFGSSESALSDVARTVWPTTATPATFAPPIDVHEDDSALTVYFHVGNRPASSLEVTFSGGMVFVVGSGSNTARYSHGVRAFLLRSSVDLVGVSTRFEAPLLIVRIPKTAAGRRTIVVQRGE